MARESGQDICERLNVRPELIPIVSWIFDDWQFTWPQNPYKIAFIKECFAEDDRKGIIAWLTANFYPRLDDECIPDYEDTVNALYQINDNNVLTYLQLVFNGDFDPYYWYEDDEDDEDQQRSFCAFLRTLRNDIVQRRFGHSLKNLTIDELKQLIRETPGFQENTGWFRRIVHPQIDQNAFFLIQKKDPRDFQVESRPKVLERRKGLLQLIDMGQRRGEREDQEYQEMITCSPREQFAMPIGTGSKPNIEE